MTSPVPLSDFINKQFEGKSPYQVAVATAVFLGAVEFLRTAVLSSPVIITARDNTLQFVRRTILKNYLKSEIEKNIAQVKFPQEKVTEGYEKLPQLNRIPENGMSDEEIFALSKRYKAALDKKFEEEHLSGAVYQGSEAPTEFYVNIFRDHVWSNALFADYFGATRRMEGEIIDMIINLFNGKKEDGNCAAFTSGGSESIAMAMLAYRNYARTERNITNPNIVMCQTAHPAFDKACGYYGIRIIKVLCNPTTYQFDASEAAKYITDDTIALVGSAPSYAHGVVDPIAELAALAKSHGIGMHVDMCVGGFFIQFLSPAVQPITDLRVDGVTTISADIHKWGGIPKGGSFVIYRTKELRSYQMFACSSFPGGLYASMGPNGSKGGYTAALAWSALLKFGMKGYSEMSERTRIAAMKYKWAIEANEIPGLELMGNPNLSIVAATSQYYDIYLFSQKMKEKGWIYINVQFPPGAHLGLTLDHAKEGAIERLIADAKEVAASLMPPPDPVTKKVEKLKKVNYDATLYGSSQTIPDRAAVEMMLRAYVAKSVEASPY